MDNTTAAVSTVIVVTAGRWADGKGLEAKIVVGGGVYMIMLSVIDSGQPKLAGQIATLVLVTALLMYAVPLFEKMGYGKVAAPAPGDIRVQPGQGVSSVIQGLPGMDRTMQGGTRGGRT